MIHWFVPQLLKQRSFNLVLNHQNLLICFSVQHGILFVLITTLIVVFKIKMLRPRKAWRNQGVIRSRKSKNRQHNGPDRYRWPLPNLCTWGRLFQTRVMRTILDIYVLFKSAFIKKRLKIMQTDNIGWHLDLLIVYST